MSVLNPTILSEVPVERIIHNHITVQMASDVSGYNIQYLRRLLRAGKLEAEKVGQVWLIDLASLQCYLSNAITSNDLRYGPKGLWQPPF